MAVLPVGFSSADLPGVDYYSSTRQFLACAGVLVFGAILYARLLSIPLVVSYHTHIPHYIPQCAPRPGP